MHRISRLFRRFPSLFTWTLVALVPVSAARSETRGRPVRCGFRRGKCGSINSHNASSTSTFAMVGPPCPTPTCTTPRLSRHDSPVQVASPLGSCASPARTADRRGHGVPWIAGLTTALLLWSAGAVLAQTVDSTLWATDGAVSSIVRDGGTIYIGGSFNWVGPATGGGVAIDASTGGPLQPYPRIADAVNSGTGGPPCRALPSSPKRRAANRNCSATQSMPKRVSRSLP